MSAVIVLGRDWHERQPECATCPELLKRIAGDACDLRCAGGRGLTAHAHVVELDGGRVELMYLGRTYVKVGITVAWPRGTSASNESSRVYAMPDMPLRKDEAVGNQFLVLKESMMEIGLGAGERFAVHNGTKDAVCVAVRQSSRAVPSETPPFLRIDRDPRHGAWLLRGQYTLAMASGDGGAP